jgi:peptidyl-prolyl cis-trans isomerase A (cyclophilin A)
MLNHWMARGKTLLVVAGMALMTTGCSSESTEAVSASVGERVASSSAGSTTQPTNVPVVRDASATSVAPPAPQPPADREVIIKTNHGDITVKLFSSKAPLTVDNFVDGYVRRDHYTNTVMHYVDNGFMILGGGYDSQYQPKETRAIVLNEATNGLKNKRGTIAMARDPEYINSATCQFFINLADNESLDHQNTDDSAGYGYCVFGEVIAGMDVVDKIATVSVEDTQKTIVVKTQVETADGKLEEKTEQQPQPFVKVPVQAVVIQAVELVK